jgi:transposase
MTGENYNEVAKTLGVGYQTVKTHVRSLRSKLADTSPRETKGRVGIDAWPRMLP